MITGFADWVQTWAEVAPGRVAIREVESGRALTYARLSARAWRLHHALAAQGVRPGDRVAVLARNGAAAFELLVACLRLGAVYTPLNWRLAGAELAAIAAHCEPRLLVYDDPSAEGATAVFATCPDVRGVALGEPLRSADARHEDLIARAAGDPEPVAHGGETPAMLLYTSGTTGRPKGALLPHRQLFWNAVNTVWATDLGPGDRALACLPLFHTGGLNCLATPTLYRGGTVVLMTTFDPERALEAVARERVTITVAVPTMYQMLLDAGVDDHDTSSLATLLCGGAPCPDTLLDAWLDRGFNFRQGFGMTEVGPNCFSLPPSQTRRKRGSVGRPVLHGDAGIFDDGGRPLPPGAVGELWLRGPHAFAGYWRAPEETAAVLGDDGWVRTGDLARRDEDGFFWVAGRRKDMFISGGENVYPAEIENAILHLPGVAEVAVVAIPDPRWGEVGLAAVVPRPGSDLDVEAIRAHCAARLARFKVPKRIELVDDLPKNASGKVIKAAVRERFATA